MDLDLLARQLARLLSRSDRDELREVVRRWLETAPTAGDRERMQELGERVLELKAALVTVGKHPSEDELVAILGPMLGLALEHGRAPIVGGRGGT